MKAGVSRSGQLSKWVTRPCAGSDVGRYIGGRVPLASTRRRNSTLIAWLLPLIAFCAFNEMNCVAVLDFVACERIRILQHPTGVYQALSRSRYVGVFGGGELVLEIGDGR